MTPRVCLLLILVLPGFCAANEKDVYKKQVLPILKTYCVRCHGPKKQESRIRLDTLSTDLIKNRAAAEYWHEVLNVLNAGEMPPKDARQLSARDRKILVDWVRSAIQRAVEARRKTDGRVVIRRLNRVFYQNTMTDLLGIRMDYNRDFPPDGRSSEGFTNDGGALRMSAIQLEYYLQSARRALDRIIVTGQPPRQYKYLFTKPNVRAWLGRPQFSNRLQRQQQFLAKMVKDYPEQGEFLVRVRFQAELKPNTGFPLMEVSVGYRPDTQILFRVCDTVQVTTEKERVMEFRGRLEEYPLPVRGQGKFPGLVVRVRNMYDDGSRRPKGKGKKRRGMTYPVEKNLSTLVIKSVEFHAPIYKQWPPTRHRQILFDSPLRKKDESAYVAAVLQRFMRRAFRRPVKTGEVKRLVGFYKAIRPGFPTFAGAMRETLAMVLISPDFLYLMEPGGKARRPVSDWELATRLSYFLWSSMPDQRLFDLAASGKLRDAKVMNQEVERMLLDQRAGSFVEQFTEEWLKLSVVDRVAVSRDYYPKFKATLKQHMRGETQSFFGELLRHNLSALHLLHSDFTMLNEPMAKHYGIPGIYGQHFRRVKLPANLNRGGVLGHASILLSNSTGSDSHPVRRAVWIRDRLLNDPPAPPPPDVPSLEEADPKFHKLSVREQLVIHRKREACASCHRGIDPWGIALENFDAVGLWRTKVRRKHGKKFATLPIVAKDTLPSGKQLNGVKQLKDYLIDKRKDDFAKSLVSRLLVYALGRKLELTDKTAIDNLTRQFAQDGYRLRTLVQRIATSPPFLTK